MNKLETITQLLVNELTDFEANVKRLENGLQRAEDLRVKFDLAPIDNLVSELKSFQLKETENREAYVIRLNRKLENAKIYPKWAVVTFIIAIIISVASLFFGYYQLQNIESSEQTGYARGKQDATEYINLYFTENPDALDSYKNWAKSK